MKGKRGITLIALIITIIILLILAGVAINAIVGDNGVVSQAQKAKTRTEETKLEEDVGMAYDEIYAEKLEDVDLSGVTVREVVEKLENKYGYSGKIRRILSGVETEIKLKEKIGVTENGTKTVSVLEGDGIEYYADVKGAYYKIKQEGSNVVIEKLEGLLEDLESMKLEIVSDDKEKIDETIAKASLDEDNSLLKIEGIKKGDTIIKVKLTSREMVTEGEIKIGVYKDNGSLKDVADIGDYVDIGLDYENVASSDYGIPLTGWRILSIDEKNDKIQLVSAGCPLTYYFDKNVGDVKLFITNLEDLYKSIQLNNGQSSYFKLCGFSGVDNVENSIDLTNVFNNSFINIKDGVHALGCGTNSTDGKGEKTTAYEKKDEVETLYSVMTGKTKSMNTFLGWYSYAFANSKIKADMNEGYEWKNSYSGLLNIGQSYYLGGSSYSNTIVYEVYKDGCAFYTGSSAGGGTLGIRPVVSLKSGITIDTENAGSGLSSDSALMIK